MPISFPSPPEQSVLVLQEAIEKIFRIPLLNQIFANRIVQLDDLEISFAHRIYSARLDYLAEGTGLERVILSSWRYLIGSSLSSNKLVAEVNVDSSGEKHIFSQVCDDPACRSLDSIFKKAIADLSVANQDLIFQVLRVPALLVSFIWFRSQSEDNDLFVALPSVSNFIEARRYGKQELVQELQNLAREKLANSTTKTN
jgi:hypothetical protein